MHSFFCPFLISFSPLLPGWWFSCKQRFDCLPSTSHNHHTGLSASLLTRQSCWKVTTAPRAPQVNPCLRWFQEDLAPATITTFILKTLLCWNSSEYLPAVDTFNYRGNVFHSLLLLICPKSYLKHRACLSASPFPLFNRGALVLGSDSTAELWNRQRPQETGPQLPGSAHLWPHPVLHQLLHSLSEVGSLAPWVKDAPRTEILNPSVSVLVPNLMKIKMLTSWMGIKMPGSLICLPSREYFSVRAT